MLGTERKNQYLSTKARLLTAMLVTAGTTTACGLTLTSEKPIAPTETMVLTPEGLPKDILSEEQLKAAGVEIRNSSNVQLFLRKAFLESKEAKFLREPGSRRSLRIILLDESRITLDRHLGTMEEQYESQRGIITAQKERLEELRTEEKVNFDQYEELQKILTEREERCISQREERKEKAQKYFAQLKREGQFEAEILYNLKYPARNKNGELIIGEDDWPIIEEEYILLVAAGRKEAKEYLSYPDESIYSSSYYTTTVMGESQLQTETRLALVVRHGLKHLVRNLVNSSDANVDLLVRQDLEKAAAREREGNDEDYFVVLVSPFGTTISENQGQDPKPLVKARGRLVMIREEIIEQWRLLADFSYWQKQKQAWEKNKRGKTIS